MSKSLIRTPKMLSQVEVKTIGLEKSINSSENFSKVLTRNDRDKANEIAKRIADTSARLSALVGRINEMIAVPEKTTPVLSPHTKERVSPPSTKKQRD